MTEKIVLDSWAIMAWVKGEPAGALVIDLIETADGTQKLPSHLQRLLGGAPKHIKLLISMMNLGEVFYLAGQRKGEEFANELLDHIRVGPIQVVSVSDALVHKAAWLTLKHRVGYADAFGLATALIEDAKFATGDPELKKFREAPILWLGEKP